MTFEEWDQTHYPEQPNNLLAGVERGQRRAGWNAGQEAMRERASTVLRACAEKFNDDDYHGAAEIVNNLPVE